MDSVKDKIAKLMAMATDGRGNEFEAEAAMRLAERLMRKHGIEVAELAGRTGQKPVYDWSTVNVPADKVPLRSIPRWLGVISYGIARFTDTMVSVHWMPVHGICLRFQGDAIDVQYAVWLAKHLRDDCRRQSAAFQATYNVRREREDFRFGYAGRVQDRLMTLRRERDEALKTEVVTSTSNALVVVNQKIALRDAEFGRQQVRNTSRRHSSAHARSSGRAAGDRVGLGRPLGGGSKLLS